MSEHIDPIRMAVVVFTDGIEPEEKAHLDTCPECLGIYDCLATRELRVRLDEVHLGICSLRRKKPCICHAFYDR